VRRRLTLDGVIPLRAWDAASKTISFVSLRSVDLHHAVAGCKYERLQARVDTQLGEDARNVVALGLGADVMPPGNLLDIKALGKGLQHPPFARRLPRSLEQPQPTMIRCAPRRANSEYS
jgi:hypothetical protein